VTEGQEFKQEEQLNKQQRQPHTQRDSMPGVQRLRCPTAQERVHENVLPQN
jgi:hypothetical protein